MVIQQGQPQCSGLGHHPMSNIHSRRGSNPGHGGEKRLDGLPLELRLPHLRGVLAPCESQE